MITKRVRRQSRACPQKLCARFKRLSTRVARKSRDELFALTDALMIAPPEQLDAHDGEDEPEDEANEQHVEDGGDRLDQRVHHHLQTTPQKRHGNA